MWTDDVELCLAVLTANVEKRLAALKSSTQINGFQHLLLRLYFSEANASGMVSMIFCQRMQARRMREIHVKWMSGNVPVNTGIFQLAFALCSFWLSASVKWAADVT